jgi:hypothetical protein
MRGGVAGEQVSASLSYESLYAACDEKTAKTMERGGPLDKKGRAVWPA